MKRVLVNIFISTLLITSLSACFKTKADIKKEQEQAKLQQNLNKNIANQEETLISTQSKVGKLEGKLEEMEFYRKKELEENRNTLTNFSERINMLEEKVAQQEKTQAELINEIKRMQQDNLRALQSSSRPAKSGGNSFQKGLAAFKKKQYSEAAALFSEFSTQNPKSKSFLQAKYLEGQSHFNQRKFSDAIVAYSAVFESNSNDATWRKSTLNIARSFYKMGKKSDARPFAEAVIKKFPKSDEANRAKSLLK